jgi:hypothetical protein
MIFGIRMLLKGLLNTAIQYIISLEEIMKQSCFVGDVD